MTVENETITAAQLMTSELFTTGPDASVAAFAHELIERGLSGAPVVEADGTLVGMASDFDLIAKHGATVSDVMSRGVVTVGQDATLAEIVRLMGLHGIRRLPVLRGGRLVGTVSRSDILRHLFGASR